MLIHSALFCTINEFVQFNAFLSHILLWLNKIFTLPFIHHISIASIVCDSSTFKGPGWSQAIKLPDYPDPDLSSKPCIQFLKAFIGQFKSSEGLLSDWTMLDQFYYISTCFRLALMSVVQNRTIAIAITIVVLLVACIGCWWTLLKRQCCKILLFITVRLNWVYVCVYVQQCMPFTS